MVSVFEADELVPGLNLLASPTPIDVEGINSPNKKISPVGVVHQKLIVTTWKKKFLIIGLNSPFKGESHASGSSFGNNESFVWINNLSIIPAIGNNRFAVPSLAVRFISSI